MSSKKDFTSKKKVKPLEPCKRAGHVCVSDMFSLGGASSNVTFMIGGYSDSSLLSDVWAFDKTGGGSWSELRPPASAKGGKGSSLSPFPRTDFNIAILGDNIFLFGGMLIDDDNSVSIWNDLWVFSITSKTWRLVIEESACSERYGHAMVSLPEGFLIHGGECNSKLGDLWYYRSASNSFVSLCNSAGPGPCARSGHSLACSPDGCKVVMFGGAAIIDGDAQFMNDIWVLDISNRANPQTWVWSSIVCNDIAPSPREGACVVPIGTTEIMIFGGYGLSSSALDDESDSGSDAENEGSNLEENKDSINSDSNSNSSSKSSGSKNNNSSSSISAGEFTITGEDSISAETTVVKSSSVKAENGSMSVLLTSVGEISLEKIAGENSASGGGAVVKSEDIKEANNDDIDNFDDGDDDDDVEIEYLNDVWVINFSTGDVREVTVSSELPPCRGARAISLSDAGVLMFGGSGSGQNGGLQGLLPIIVRDEVLPSLATVFKI